MNVSGNSYNITDLTPGVSYNITLVAIGNGVRSDSISISTITLASGKHVQCMLSIETNNHISLNHANSTGTQNKWNEAVIK